MKASASKTTSRKAQTREAAILLAATKLFREKGYSNTSVEDIASAVGMLKGSLYHYFASKEEILYRIVKPLIETSVAEGERILASDLPPLEQLREVLRVHVRSFDENFPEMFVFVQENYKVVRPAMRREIYALGKQYEAAVDAIIRRAIDAGAFRQDLDVRVMSYGILGMCNWMHRWYKKGRGFSAVQIAEMFFDMIAYGVVPQEAVAPQAGGNGSQATDAVQPRSRKA